MTGQRVEHADTRREIDVEALLRWAIGAEHADRVVEYLDREAVRPGSYGQGISADGCWAVERYATLGTFVDCSGSGGYEVAHVHPDAEAVYRALKAVAHRDILPLIVQHARAGTRPEHTPCPVVVMRWVPELDFGREPPRPRVATIPRTGARYCPVRFEVQDNAAILDNARWLYAAWRKTLLRLEAALEDGRGLTEPAGLRRWRLTAWDVDERPWNA